MGGVELDRIGAVLWRRLAEERGATVAEVRVSAEGRVLRRALGALRQRRHPLRANVERLPLPVAAGVLSAARVLLDLPEPFARLWLRRQEDALDEPPWLVDPPEAVAWARSRADVRAWLHVLQANGQPVGEVRVWAERLRRWM